MRKFNHEWSVWNIREWRHRTGSEGPVGTADIGIMRLSAWILTGMFVGTKTRDTFCFLENCLIKIVQTHTTCEPSNLLIYLHYTICISIISICVYSIYLYLCFVVYWVSFAYVHIRGLGQLTTWATAARFLLVSQDGTTQLQMMSFWCEDLFSQKIEIGYFCWLASGQELGFNLLIFYTCFCSFTFAISVVIR